MNQQEIFEYIKKQYPANPERITQNGKQITIFKNQRNNIPYAIFYQSDESVMSIMEVQAESDMISNYSEMSIEAVQAFEKWTDFYTKYSFVQTYDAFSRFRTGEYPIVIANYTFFNQLAVASPEIKGLWDFCQVPGTLREDGTVSHAANSTGSGAVIFKKVSNKENAWKFIKWFTSTDAQVKYGNNIESILGTMGRYATANEEALQQLSWTTSEVNLLLDQLNSQVEIPIIPASYGVTRNVMNAFRAVVNDYDNARDTLFWYNKDINDEITRKLEDLGLYDN